MRSRINLLSVFTIFTNALFAQEEVLLPAYIDTVTIETIKEEKLYAIVPAQSLSHPLNLLPGMTLLQSGQSNLLSIIHRGMASRHTHAIWNSISLNSSTNGVFDYTLMPMLYFNNTQFWNTGTSQNYGNTSIGGNVNLATEAKDAIQVMIEAGEGENYDAASSFVLRSKKVISKTGFEWAHHKNAYRYELNGLQGIAQNSAFKNIHLLHDTYLSINQNTDLHFAAWWQNANRKIPTFLPNGIIQLQEDENIRIHADINHRSQSFVFNQSVALLKESLEFQTLDINSVSNVTTLQSLSSFTLKKNLNIKIVTKQEIASPNFFDSTKKRNETIATIQRNVEVGLQKNITLQISPRLVDGKTAPFTFNALADVGYSNGSFNVKMGRNLQLPSLNDLYWPNGGDQTLLSEVAWQGGVSWNHDFNSLHRLSASVFNNYIDNFIQWAPENNGFWRAFNRKKVWSRGFETIYSTTFSFRSNNLIKLKMNYGFTKSTSQKDIKNPTTTGKQLPYVPLHKLTLSNEWRHKIYRIGIDLMYQSKRYESSDNFSSLPGFLAMNAAIGIHLNSVSIALNIENLTDVKYTLLTGFPRPLRRFEILVYYHLTNKDS